MCIGTETKIEKELRYIRNFSFKIFVKSNKSNGTDLLTHKHALAYHFATEMYEKALFMDDEVLHYISPKIKKCLNTYCDIEVEFEDDSEKFKFYSDDAGLHELEDNGVTYYSIISSSYRM